MLGRQLVVILCSAISILIVATSQEVAAFEDSEIAVTLRECAGPYVEFPPRGSGDAARPVIDCALQAVEACSDAWDWARCLRGVTSVLRDESANLEASISLETDIWARPIFSELLRKRKICRTFTEEEILAQCHLTAELEHLELLLQAWR